MKKLQSSKPFFSLTNASFRLGDSLVFENTSWTFCRDQQWAIIGPNGSGKSLFCDAIRGQLPLVEGLMKFHLRSAENELPDEAIRHVSFEQRKAALRGAVVQSRWNSLEDEGALTVRDYLSYERVMEVNPFEVTNVHTKERPAFAKRMRRAIPLLGVEPFLDRLLISLSNGELQKVQLARVLACRMRLLILDEPFAGLDAASREHFHQVLAKLMRANLHILLITTRAEDLPRHVTHLLCVDNCKVIAAGHREEVLSMPQVRRMFSFTKPPLPRLQRFKKDGQKPTLLNGETLVEMHDVTVQYGRAVILKNMNWTIRAGESWALLGPNGSGKSTLLSLILGDNPQVYVNNVTLFGRPRGAGESMWEIKQRIGWFSPELHQHFDGSATCFQVVASGFHDSIGLFQSITAKQRKNVLALMAEFDLVSYANEPLCALSAGLQKMALLVRALVKNPLLLILDEPCQGLDADHRKAFVQTIDSIIRSRPISVIFVTHRTDEIPPSVTRTLKLRARG